MSSTIAPDVPDVPDVAHAKARLREQATTVREDLRELGKIAREAAKDTAGHYLDQSKHQYEEIEDQVVTYIRQKPVKSMLIATGAGLLLGYLFSKR